METEEKGLTLRAYVFGSILVIFWTILIHMIGGFSPYFPETTANSVIFGIFTMFLLSLVASKFNFNPQEYTAIYSMILVSTVFAATWTFTIYGQVIEAIGNLEYNKYGLAYMPSIFGPRDPDLVRGAFFGGASVPWEAWLVPMFYWITLSLVICFSGLFLSCILRKQYIDVETLPFPIATPITTMIKERSFFKMRNLKYVLIGMFIGFIWPQNLAFLLSTIYPPLAIEIPGTIDLAPFLWSILPMAILSIGWGNVALLAFAYLIPNDILLTSIVLHFVFLWIIPPIEVSLGLLNAPADYAAPGMWLYRFADTVFKGPVHFSDIARYGALIGLGIVPLFTQWKHIVHTLKCVIHPEHESESREPLPYRWAWFGYIATLIITLYLLSIGGMPLWIAIVFLLLFNILTIGLTRLRGESGGWAGNADELISPLHATLYQVGFEANITDEAVKTACWRSLMLAGTYTWWGTAIALPPPITSMEAFRIASITRTKSKDIFVSLSIAIIIAILIGFPFALWGIYNYGVTSRWIYSRIDASFVGDQGFWQNLRAAFYVGGAPVSWTYPPDWIQTGIGVLMVALFTFLRMRYLWFPFNPVGIPLAGFVLSPSYVFLWLVAYIIKYVTLKVGGTKLYEEKGVPMAVGIIIAWAIVLFLGGIISLIRFI
ncbi:MAG: OPT/YSL family transporter [Candidatus Jordarchaeaceae archaeon]